MRNLHLNTVEAVRPFAFEKFGQVWTADFMNGPKLYRGKKKHKSYHHLIISSSHRSIG